MTTDETTDQWTRGRSRETPVTDRCMLCKEETPDDEQVALASGEYLCRSCHGDLRTFKRTRPVQLWATPAARPATRRMLRDQYDTQRSLLGELFVEYNEITPLPSRQSRDK